MEEGEIPAAAFYVPSPDGSAGEGKEDETFGLSPIGSPVSLVGVVFNDSAYQGSV